MEISKGESQFHTASMMRAAAEHTFGSLAASGLVSGASIDDEEFVRLAADVLANINYMHPFREGNGRTQRAFLDDVAAVSGLLDLPTKVSASTWLRLCGVDVLSVSRHREGRPAGDDDRADGGQSQPEAASGGGREDDHRRGDELRCDHKGSQRGAGGE